jgi:hypothetical protein
MEPNKKDEHFGYYPHPDTHGPCYRVVSDDGRPAREFLMINLAASQPDMTTGRFRGVQIN